MALKRKVKQSEQTPLDDSDSASDIQRKTDKTHQKVLPQRKSLVKTNTNKILDTSSSNSTKNNNKLPPLPPSSGSLSFPDDFSIPNAASSRIEQVVEKKKLPDTIPFTEEDENVEKNKMPDTIPFSEEELPSNKPQTQIKKIDKEKFPTSSLTKKKLPDTIPFSDEDEDGYTPQRLPTPAKSIVVEKTLFPVKKASDTIIGFSNPSEHLNNKEQEEENDEDDEVIPILDSDEEESEKVLNQGPPARTTSFLNCSRSTQNSLNNFFNNPPSVNENHVVGHQDILKFKKQVMAEENLGTVLQDIEIGATDEEDNVIDLTINESPEKPATPAPTLPPPQRSGEAVSLNKNTPHRQVSAQISTNTPKSGKKKNVTNINIKFDLKINIQEGSGSESESPASKNSTNQEEENVRVERLAIEGNKEMTPVYKTPEKVEENLIDQESQDILNQLYGESWKTPQLLRSCKSTRFRENLRKSIHANNFESFVRNLPCDLESTRITPVVSKKKDNFLVPTAPVSSSKKNKRTDSESNSETTPSNSQKIKKTPISQKIITPKETPKYLEICDPETSSDSSSYESENSDDDFNPNDTWNASSDEEYENEQERIKKRLTIRQSIRHDELTFTRDESIEEQEKIEILLKKYEFTKPPTLEKKMSKRKLFTHSHYEEEEKSELIAKKSDEKENEAPKEMPILAKKPSTPRVVQKTPKVQSSASKNRFGPLGFLKSLDVEANRNLCDPNALYYRDNYKTKKHELAQKLFKLYNEKVFENALLNVDIKWNKKLLNTAGRCHNSRRDGERKSFLELSDKVLTSADRLRCTLIHEMCHAASWILNGENGHGAVWKGWAAKANRIFPELPKISVCHDYVIEYRYTYLCINCRAQSKTHSKSRKVEEIQCSICKGSIKLFENKRNAAGEIEMIPVEKKELKGKLVR